jgi:transposase InsO family protein
MARGFVYLAVVLDWATRRVLSWRLSITMEAAFCVETLEDALALHGRPEIFNTDQGSQFTGSAFTGVLASNAIAISMDGKGAWRDNLFIERLWRSVKYEEVYLRAYETVSEARNSIGRYLDAARIRALTDAPRIKPTSPRCRSAWQPNPAEAALIDAEILFRRSGPAQSGVQVGRPIEIPVRMVLIPCFTRSQRLRLVASLALSNSALSLVLMATAFF